MTTPWWAIAIYLVGGLLSAIAQYFIKVGADRLNLACIKRMVRNHNIAIGGFIYIGATLIGLAALRYGSLSVLYPFAATSFIWVVIIANKWLGEKVNLYKIMGVCAIVFGVAFVGLGA